MQVLPDEVRSDCQHLMDIEPETKAIKARSVPHWQPLLYFFGPQLLGWIPMAIWHLDAASGVMFGSAALGIVWGALKLHGKWINRALLVTCSLATLAVLTDSAMHAQREPGESSRT